MQKTVSAHIEIKGIGLHSGAEITLTIKPAKADSGIIFIRTDITDKNNQIPALWNAVVDTQLCTVIANEDGISVGTIEHLMSALRGCGIDNAEIYLDGAEVPIMDGSAMPFVEAIDAVGTQSQNTPRKVIKILKTVTAEHEGKKVSLSPDSVATFGGQIAFDHPEIGTQKFETQMLNGNFRHDIANARTFGFLQEVEWMRANGLAQGGSLDNAIVLDTDKVMNPDGLRFEDEFIRHKLLDAIGDLYLAGFEIIGAYDGYKAGHDMNNRILHALFADPDAYEIIALDAQPHSSNKQATAAYA